jgi:hypothetical protein
MEGLGLIYGCRGTTRKISRWRIRESSSGIPWSAGIWLDFTSELYGDEFDGAAAPDGSAAINYDFDGDGQAETRFLFQQVMGG